MSLILLAALPAMVAEPIPVSARDVAVKSVDRRIEGKSPERALARFADYPATASKGEFKPNPDFWAKEVDFSCASPWNSAGGNLRAGTAISRRIIIFANHFPMGKGVRVTFVGTDGTPTSCAISDTKRVPGTDLCLGLLDAELPPTVNPAKLLPAGYQQYIGQGGGFPVVTLNQREEAIVANIMAMSDLKNRCRVFGIYPKNFPDRMVFNRELIVGDSGSPAFFIFGTEPVLLYLLQAGMAGSGDSPHMVRELLEKTMSELRPGERPTYFDFSKYEKIK